MRASHALLTPAELDRRTEGSAAEGEDASTVAVAQTTALPVAGRAVVPAPAETGRAVERRRGRGDRKPWPASWKWALAALGLLLVAALAGAWYFAWA